MVVGNPEHKNIYMVLMANKRKRGPELLTPVCAFRSKVEARVFIEKYTATHVMGYTVVPLYPPDGEPELLPFHSVTLMLDEHTQILWSDGGSGNDWDFNLPGFEVGVPYVINKFILGAGGEVIVKAASLDMANDEAYKVVEEIKKRG
jgi:hypothetical protein